MRRMLIGTGAVVALLATSGVVRATGLPDIGSEVFAFFFMAFPAALMLPFLIAAVLMKVSGNTKSRGFGLCIAVVAILLAMMLLLFWGALQLDWRDGRAAILASGILAGFGMILAWLITAPGRGRRRGMATIAGLFLLVNLTAPSVIRFDYYTIVDNELPPPNEELFMLSDDHARLGDGTLIKFEGYSPSMDSGDRSQVLAKSAGPEQYEIFIALQKRSPDPIKPTFHVPVFERVFEKNYYASQGRTSVLPRTKAVMEREFLEAMPYRHQCPMPLAREALAAGADPSHAGMLNRKRQTLLLSALRSDCDEIVRLLVEAGADLSGTDHESVTPLEWAVGKCEVETTELLLEAGAPLPEAFRDFERIEDIACPGSASWRQEKREAIGKLLTASANRDDAGQQTKR